MWREGLELRGVIWFLATQGIPVRVCHKIADRVEIVNVFVEARVHLHIVFQLPGLHQCEQANRLLGDYSRFDLNSENINKRVSYAENLLLAILAEGE